MFCGLFGRSEIEIRFRGVRGSHAVAAPSHRRYGAETTCCEVRVAGRIIVFDAGSGIISLGHEIIKNKEKELSLFFTHFHNDHYYGLYYFAPIYRKSREIAIIGPSHGKGSLKANLDFITDRLIHPVYLSETLAKKHYLNIEGGETFVYKEGNVRPYLRKSGKTKDDEVVVRCLYNKNHSQLGSISYRVEYRGVSFVFATDIESDKDIGYAQELAEFAAGADLLAMDGQYTDDEYKVCIGWGHSAYSMACRTAEAAGVKKLAIIHHDPSHDDKKMSEIAKDAKSLFKSTVIAKEGMEIDLS